MTSGRRDRGSATVLVLAACAGLLAVTAAVATVLSAGLGRQRAETAADLAALAGEAASLRGDDGCARAAVVATAQSARVVTCAAVGDDLVVETEVRLPGPARWIVPGDADGPVARARSRAGAVP